MAVADKGTSGAAASGHPAGFRTSHGLFVVIAAAIVVLAMLRRVAFGFEAPLWLDETYTGVIATQPGAGALLTRLLQEIGGPVYYVFIWLWEKVSGPSDLALRIPSFAFAIATSIFIWWKGHPDRVTRILWCLLCTLWIPIFHYASEARSYTLLYFLATVQIAVFVRLMRNPSVKLATVWAIVSGLFILTHYHALVITFLQGICYLAVHREKAMRTWPAIFPFLPVFVWMGFHFPLVLRFSSPELAWQTILTRSDVLPIVSNVFPLPHTRIAIAIIVVSFAVDLVLRRRAGAPLPYRQEDMLAFGVSTLCLALVVGMGFVRPSFTLRYVIPFMPGVLLGLAIWCRAMTERAWWASWVLLIALVAGMVADTMRLRNTPDGRWVWNWEIASADLQSAGARRLFFTWDSPTAALGGVEAASFRNELASFFFRRAGHPIPTEALVMPPGTDPNILLLARATKPGDAIIWAFDRNVPRTLARQHPPRLAVMDKQLRCRDYGGYNISIITCLRLAGTTSAILPATPGRLAR